MQITPDHCDYFDYIDLPVTEHYRRTLNQLRAMDNGQPLRMQRRLTRAKENLHVALAQRDAAVGQVVHLNEEIQRMRNNGRVHLRVLVNFIKLVCVMLVGFGVGRLRG